MPSTIKISLVCASLFLVAELALRWWVRSNVKAGSTIPLFSDLYMANAKNVNSVMAFGLGSQAWLLIALAISLALVLAFLILLQVPQISQSCFVATGTFSAFALVAVVTANLLEAILLGGVTDYLALVDVNAGRATVVNLGDVVLFASMATIVVSAIGAGISLIVAMTRAVA